MIRAIGVVFGDNLEQFRDPWLVSCALVLIVLALCYLLCPGIFISFENTLAMKKPTGFKRLFGGLLILLPGVFILGSTYFTQFTQAFEQRWPGLARQYISTSETQNRELVAHTTTRSRARNRTRLATTSDPALELKQKQAARRKLKEKRLREQERRKKRNANIWKTKGGEVAAVNKVLLDEAVKYLADKNLEAFHQLEAAQRVLLFKEEERVSIVEYEYTSGKVRIKLLSSNMELWTFRKSLTKG